MSMFQIFSDLAPKAMTVIVMPFMQKRFERGFWAVTKMTQFHLTAGATIILGSVL
jgi:hypothetical protein